jgi:hypothetical protein
MGPHFAKLQRNHRRFYLAMIFGGSLPLAAIFLRAAPKRRNWNTLLGVMVVTLVVMVPACGGGGGGGGGHQQDPGTPAGRYAVTVTATAGSIIEQGSFLLVVQ